VLRQLVESGVLLTHDHGRAKTYELASSECELIKQLRELFAAERRRYRSVLGELRGSVRGVLSIVLFGSEARNGAKPGSDTDLLVVVEKRSDELEDRIRDLCVAVAERHALSLSWHLADLDDLREWEETGHDFWQNVVTDGIRLSGDSIEGLRRKWQRGRSS